MQYRFLLVTFVAESVKMCVVALGIGCIRALVPKVNFYVFYLKLFHKGCLPFTSEIDVGF